VSDSAAAETTHSSGDAFKQPGSATTTCSCDASSVKE
jgi:hypothetical protein